MADPHNETSLQHCMTRTEHLFAWWQKCNGNPDHHRGQEFDLAVHDMGKLRTNIRFLEELITYGQDRVNTSMEALRHIHESMGSMHMNETRWNDLCEQRNKVIRDYQKASELLMSSKSEKSRPEKELAQAFDTHRQIVEERKRLESFKKAVIEPSEFGPTPHDDARAFCW